MATTTQTSKATTAPASTGGTVVPPSKSPSVTTVEGGSGKRKWLWLLLVLIVGAAAAAGTYYYMHQQEQQKEAQVSAQIAQLQQQLAQVKKQTSKSPSDSSGVKITPLGVELTVPNSIKDLVFSDAQSGTLDGGATYQYVRLSTQKLSGLDSDCSVTGSSPALGSLSKTAGQYPASATVYNASGTLVKQFDSYYIAYSAPQAVCGSAASTQSEATADLNMFRSALSTVQPGS